MLKESIIGITVFILIAGIIAYLMFLFPDKCHCIKYDTYDIQTTNVSIKGGLGISNGTITKCVEYKCDTLK